jgi:type II restriction/modification system DNA methylase subunit YeeA
MQNLTIMLVYKYSVKKLNLHQLELNFIRMTLEKSQKQLDPNQSELDFITMVLSFIILTIKANLDFASIELDSIKNMSWTAHLKRV